MELKEGTRIRTREEGWPQELIEKFEKSDLTDRQVRSLLALHLNGERAGRFLEAATSNPMIGKLDLGWAMPTTELGMRAQPGKDGLGMVEINIGTYGHVPDRWPYQNDTPLGSHPTPGSYMPGPYHVYDKSEVWAEGVDALYDQAIRERWVPAVDIEWAALKEQPEELERAICQICTHFAENGLTESKLLASWEEKIAYGFHDVKNFVSTQVFDAGRKVEVLRKRALANGGGLLQSNLGTMYRAWFGALKPTEWMVGIDVVYKAYELTAFEVLAEVCPEEVDRDIFSRLAADSRRHFEFGVRHLRWYLQHHQDAREFLFHFLNRSEGALAIEMMHSRATPEAFAVLFAGGLENIAAGVEKVKDLRRAQMRRYVEALDSCSYDRLPQINSDLMALSRTGGLVGEPAESEDGAATEDGAETAAEGAAAGSNN
ncbi:MAG: hypothetical protein ACE5EF_03950 [Dehalococcoidia bacterium]